MKHQKWLICLCIFLFGCASENNDDYLEKPGNNNQGTQAQYALNSDSASDPAEIPGFGCKPPINAFGLDCLMGKYFIRLYYHKGEFTNASCYKGTNLPKKLPHANVQLKKFKKIPASIQEAQLTHKIKGAARSVFNVHFGVYKSFAGEWCYVLWITSGYLQMCKKNPGGECICFNRCFLTPEELKDWVKEDVGEFAKKFSKFMGMQAVVGLAVFGAVEGLSLVAADQAIKCFANPCGSICKFFLNFALQPAGEDFDDNFNDDLDEPDDDPDHPVGPNSCACNLPENDGNICFDDTVFGKPNPQEYKSELTVVGRDENFLYIFGKDAQLYNRAVFWSEPNPDGLANCESWGQWDGTFMVHKLQPCRTWFALTNESKTIWLSPDATTARVVEGVAVVPYGQEYNFTLTCGAEPNDFNLLKPEDFKNSECLYLSLDEALYANKNVCFDDTIAVASLPGNVKPELTVVTRRENYVHIFGNNAEIYHHGVFWTSPNPENLPNFEIDGEWNGFSMVFKLPPCRPWFALSNDAKTVWLAPDGSNTRLEDGVSAMPDGQGYSFVLACGAEPNSLNLLSPSDFIQEEQEETENLDASTEPNQPAAKDDCQTPAHFIVSRLDNNVELQGKNASKLKVAQFWAWPNASAPYDNIQWSKGIFDGCQMWYPIPAKQNSANLWRFVFYEDANFNGVIGPWYQGLEIGAGIAAVYQETDLVFEIQ